jgi:murein DD-endopeptidase MepM/ murein hydrolase activator NlpD
VSIRQPVPGFAWRAPGSAFSGGHQAVDVPAPCGTPVVAVADGVVSFAGFESGSGAGNVVKVGHRIHSPASTRYGQIREGRADYSHLQSIAANVRAGVAVRAGDVLGYVGQTGHAFGCHLHFAWRMAGATQDYRAFLAGGPFGAWAVDSAGMKASAGNVGPLQSIFTGDKLIPLKRGQSCTPPYQPAAVDPRLAGVFGLNVLTGWADTTPFDQLKPQGQGQPWEWANACVYPDAFTAGDEANKVGVAEAYGLLGQALQGIGTILRSAGLLVGLVVLLLLGIWVLVKSPGGAGASVAVG